MPRSPSVHPHGRQALVIIGLVGGVGCGKSTVARELEALGAERIDADALAHEALELPQVQAAVVGRFGPGVLGPERRIDRKSLGRIAFSAPEGLRFLERIIHPVVGREIRKRLVALRRSGRCEAVVLDVPLLAEAGLDRLCHAVVYIATRREDRRVRTIRDRGWSPDAVAERERFQYSLAEKRRRAGFRVDNRGSREDLTVAVGRLFQRIRSARDAGRLRKPSSR